MRDGANFNGEVGANFFSLSGKVCMAYRLSPDGG